VGIVSITVRYSFTIGLGYCFSHQLDDAIFPRKLLDSSRVI
jgi:hypothetical protein